MTAHQQMQALLSAVATLTDEVSEIKCQMVSVVEQTTATKEIVEAWTAAKTMGRFVKWLGSIATAVAAVWVLIKVGFSHYLTGGKP